MYYENFKKTRKKDGEFLVEFDMRPEILDSPIKKDSRTFESRDDAVAFIRAFSSEYSPLEKYVAKKNGVNLFKW